MKKILLLVSLLVVFGSGQYLYSVSGSYDLWSGDTLRGDSTKIADQTLLVSNFNYLHLWAKTTNPADSTNYRIYTKFALSPSDTFCVINDTTGTAVSTTILQLSDTLWHYRVIPLNDATGRGPYMKVFMSALTDHGNRACVWAKIFLSK